MIGSRGAYDQVPPIRVLHPSGHRHWFRDSQMTQFQPMRVSPGTFGTGGEVLYLHGGFLHMDCIKPKQGRQGTGLHAFVNKCYWNPAMPISFCIDCGCFVQQGQSRTGMTEITWPSKPKLFTMWGCTGNAQAAAAVVPRWMRGEGGMTAGAGHTWKRLDVRMVKGQCAWVGMEMRGSCPESGHKRHGQGKEGPRESSGSWPGGQG